MHRLLLKSVRGWCLLDTYRGLVMFLMVAEVLHLSRVAGFFQTVRSGGFSVLINLMWNGWAVRFMI